MSIEKIAVLGAGQMGNGITQVAACAGFDVIMLDIEQEYVDRGISSIEKSLAKLVAKERMTQQDADAARAVLLNIVQNLSSLREQVTRAYYLDQFFSAKFKEIASVFKGSPEATRAFDALSQMDPAHISDYSQMIN